MSFARVIAVASIAAASAFSDEGGSLTFQLDNDLFANTDKDYTNGARLSFITGNRDESDFTEMEAWLARLQRGTPRALLGFYSPESPVYNYGISLTQLMFTPNDVAAPSPPPGEHPYVGWLGLGFSLHGKDSNALNSIALSVGLTGENAFAETTQDFVHSVRNLPKFNGWDSQMPSELTVNLYLMQKRRLFRDSAPDALFSMDGFGEWGVALGNYRTALEAGFISRAGYNLPAAISDPRLGPTSHSHNLFNSSRTTSGDWSIYAIFGAKAWGSIHEISLDGPVFRNFDTGVTKQPFGGESYIGATIRWKCWELGYVHTFRSREFDEQPNGPQFGSLSLRRQF